MQVITAEVVDTGEKRDARGRRRRPDQHRDALVEAFRSSGLTMAEFARRESITYSTLAGWVARAAKRVGAREPIKFAQVQMPRMRTPSETAALLEVRLSDGTLVRGGSVRDVIAVVRGLRS